LKIKFPTINKKSLLILNFISAMSDKFAAEPCDHPNHQDNFFDLKEDLFNLLSKNQLDSLYNGILNFLIFRGLFFVFLPVLTHFFH